MMDFLKSGNNPLATDVKKEVITEWRNIND
jgi:hypothetical protein